MELNCQAETKEEALERIIKDFKSELTDDILKSCILLYDGKLTYYENSAIIDITTEILVEEDYEVCVMFLDKRTEIMLEILEEFLKKKNTMNSKISIHYRTPPFL